MALPALLAGYVNFGNGSTTGWYAVTAWAASTAYTVGQLRRQLATPTVGNERVFVCIIAGTSGGSEPTWTVTRGAKTTDNAATWQECTGQPATNGDLTNTIRWSTVKNTSVSLGVIIKDVSNNLFICSTAGTAGNGSEPTWNTTVGNTTADNTATWTCIRNGAYGAWSAPHARLGNAVAANWGGAGDDFYIGDNHAESQGSAISITFPGTAASPNRVLCVNHSGSTPPVSADLTTGASVATTGAFTLTLSSGHAYFQGITFTASSGGSSGTPALSLMTGAFSTHFRFVNCVLEQNNTSGGNINMGATAPSRNYLLELYNTQVKFARAGAVINALGTHVIWEATPNAIQGTAPTVLFSGAAQSNSYLFARGVDFNALGSGTFVNLTTTAMDIWIIYLEDCKISASTTLYGNSWLGQESGTITLVACGDTDASYQYRLSCYWGDIYHETTVVRTGGATDGTTPVARKMVTSANAKFFSPLKSDWMPLLWNGATGSPVTVQIPVVTDNVTLKDNEAWIEVEGQGTAGNPLGTYSSDAAADVLAAGANQTTDSTSTWTTTGLTTPVKQVLLTTITPQRTGVLRVRVCLARGSTTMYFDPAPADGNGRKYGGLAYQAGQSGMAQATGAVTARGMLTGGRM